MPTSWWQTGSSYRASNTKYCAAPGCGRRQSLHMLSLDANRTAWINFVFNDVSADEGKTLSVCSLHFTKDCFVNKTGFADRLRVKNGAVPSILDLTGIVQHTDSGSNMYGPIISVAILQHWTFSPTCADGWVNLIIICKTVIHTQQWAFTSKSSVRDAHKNRAFFS